MNTTSPVEYKVEEPCSQYTLDTGVSKYWTQSDSLTMMLSSFKAVLLITTIRIGRPARGKRPAYGKTFIVISHSEARLKRELTRFSLSLMYPDSWLSETPTCQINYRKVQYIVRQDTTSSPSEDEKFKCLLCNESSSKSAGRWLSSDSIRVHVEQDHCHLQFYQQLVKAYWIKQAGWLKQPFLSTTHTNIYRTDSYTCKICNPTEQMSSDQLQQHLFGERHNMTVKVAVSAALPGLRDRSRLDTLALPFVYMSFNNQTKLHEFQCLMCQTKDMPLGVLISHCQAARHTKKFEVIAKGLQSIVIPSVGINDQREELTQPASASKSKRGSRVTETLPPIPPGLVETIVEEPYISKRNSVLSHEDVVWDCLICRLAGLRAHEIAQHLQTPNHDLQRNLIKENSPILQRFSLSHGRDEYRCLLCDTKPMMLSRLPLHYDGSRHRKAISRLLSESASSVVFLVDVKSSVEKPCPTESLSIPLDDTSPEVESTMQINGNETPELISECDSILPSHLNCQAVSGSASPNERDLLAFEKLATCRSLQNLLSSLADEQQWHVNHLLLQYLLSEEIPADNAENQYLSKAMSLLENCSQEAPTNDVFQRRGSTSEIRSEVSKVSRSSHQLSSAVHSKQHGCNSCEPLMESSTATYQTLHDSDHDDSCGTRLPISETTFGISANTASAQVFDDSLDTRKPLLSEAPISQSPFKQDCNGCAIQ